MKIEYRKLGEVQVQDVVLKDPTGFPINLDISFIGDTFTLGVKAQDDRNNIGRTYEMEMDDQFKQELSQFFLVSVARVMRDKYAEFQNLELIAVK